MAKKYYTVWVGHETGVFDSWEECKLSIEGFPGARYKGFPSREEAIMAYRGDASEHIGVIKAIASRKADICTYEANPEISLNAIAVDAACSHNPGPVEYQGVDLRTGQRVFHVGPLPGGSNNMGEFLAIVHALALLDREGRSDVTIYSDSRTAMSWVRNRMAKTAIPRTEANAKIHDLVQRAQTWLQTHHPANRVVKWNTEEWGEIPADFGRK